MIKIYVEKKKILPFLFFEQPTPPPITTERQPSPVKTPEKIDNVTRREESPVKTPEKIDNVTRREESPVKTPEKIDNETRREESPVKTPEKIDNVTRREESPVKTPEKIDNETRREESPVALLPIKQHLSPISEQPTIEPANSPVNEHRLIPESLSKEEGTQTENFPQQDNIDKQPVNFLPPLRPSKIYSAPPLQKTISFEHNQVESKQSKSSIPIIENKTPTISHSQTVSVYFDRYGCILINLLFRFISLNLGIFYKIFLFL